MTLDISDIFFIIVASVMIYFLIFKVIFEIEKYFDDRCEYKVALLRVFTILIHNEAGERDAAIKIIAEALKINCDK